jgi:hypothetical protein
MRQKKFNIRIPVTGFMILIMAIAVSNLYSQTDLTQIENQGLRINDIKLNKLSFSQKSNNSDAVLLQQPKKKVYFTPGGKIGMFFLQGDYSGNQMIAIEGFGKYSAQQFFAEISVPFRFKTSPAFTDIGIDINVGWPFLGEMNKTEVDPYIGGGLGLHFIGMDKPEGSGSKIAARGGMGLNLIAGVVFLKDYDFNVILEVKYFNYLREFDNRTYQGIGLNIGATFPH